MARPNGLPSTSARPTYAATSGWSASSRCTRCPSSETESGVDSGIGWAIGVITTSSTYRSTASIRPALVAKWCCTNPSDTPAAEATPRSVVAAVPLWAKLSPNAGDISAVAEAAEKAGADAVTVSNTILGLKINLQTFRSCIGQGYGGISGPGIKAIILRMVHQCAKCVTIPVIGCGGITKAEDVVEYLLAGASAVEVGYLNFRNPTGMIAIIEGLEKWCNARGFKRVADLTGAMLDHPPRDTYEAGMMGIS